MKCPTLLLISVLIVLAFSACSTAPRHAASGPSLAAATKRSQDITETITLAESDSKEIKAAIFQLQASNKLLHKTNGEVVLILDRNDYKLRKLFESR